jgi:hypothetical protein
LEGDDLALDVAHGDEKAGRAGQREIGSAVLLAQEDAGNVEDGATVKFIEHLGQARAQETVSLTPAEVAAVGDDLGGHLAFLGEVAAMGFAEGEVAEKALIDAVEDLGRGQARGGLGEDVESGLEEALVCLLEVEVVAPAAETRGNGLV